MEKPFPLLSPLQRPVRGCWDKELAVPSAVRRVSTGPCQPARGSGVAARRGIRRLVGSCTYSTRGALCAHLQRGPGGSWWVTPGVAAPAPSCHFFGETALTTRSSCPLRLIQAALRGSSPSSLPQVHQTCEPDAVDPHQLAPLQQADMESALVHVPAPQRTLQS